MIEVDAPTRLHGGVLRDELAAAGVEVTSDAMRLVAGRLQFDVSDEHRETVEQVVADHDPPERSDPDEEFRQAVDAASSVADLKAALLGTAGPGAEPRRGRSR